MWAGKSIQNFCRQRRDVQYKDKVQKIIGQVHNQTHLVDFGLVQVLNDIRAVKETTAGRAGTAEIPRPLGGVVARQVGLGHTAES